MTVGIEWKQCCGSGEFCRSVVKVFEIDNAAVDRNHEQGMLSLHKAVIEGKSSPLKDMWLYSFAGCGSSSLVTRRSGGPKTAKTCGLGTLHSAPSHACPESIC